MTLESDIEVVEITGEVDEALVSAFRRLVPQLSRSNPPPSAPHIRALR